MSSNKLHVDADDKSGYLWKRCGWIFKTWERRYVVLKVSTGKLYCLAETTESSGGGSGGGKTSLLLKSTFSIAKDKTHVVEVDPATVIASLPAHLGPMSRFVFAVSNLDGTVGSELFLAPNVAAKSAWMFAIASACRARNNNGGAVKTERAKRLSSSLPGFIVPSSRDRIVRVSEPTPPRKHAIRVRTIPSAEAMPFAQFHSILARFCSSSTLNLQSQVVSDRQHNVADGQVVSDGQHDVSDVQVNVSDVQDDVSDVQDDVFDVQDDVADVQDDVVDVQVNVFDVQDDVVDVQNVSDVQVNVFDVQDDVVDVQVDVVDVQDDVSDVQNDVVDVQVNVSDVQDDVVDVQVDVVDVQDDVSDVQNDVVDVQVNVSDVQNVSESQTLLS
jgi:peptidoglycan hydrolase CwlO-like protein